MPNIQLAKNLRYLRKKYRLNQQEMEEILNLSRQAYSNYERCERTPDLDTLVRLSLFYNICIDDLILKDLSASSPDADDPPEPDDNPFYDGIKESVAPYYTYAECVETGNSIYLTDKELDFISSFRSLSEDNKRLITGFLNNSKQ